MTFSEQFTNDRIYEKKIAEQAIEIDKLKEEVHYLKQKLENSEVHKDSYYHQLQEIYKRMRNND